jgi:NADPH-dependent 7-cyano-7-deazaguanine reductase QueF
MRTVKLYKTITGTKIFLPFSAICTITNKEFGGEVEIEYSPQKLALEYVDTENVIKIFCKNKMTAEEFAQRIFEEVYTSIAPKHLKVLVNVKHSKAHKPVQVWIEKGKA